MKKLAVLCISLVISVSGISQEIVKSETVSLNGLKTYYEVYGKGEPLLLLHGWGQSSKYWLPYILDYYEDFEVYLVDLQGHGRSEIFDPNWSINSVANNLNDLIEYLKLDRIKSIGLSYGGDVLFQLAVINPMVIESMIIIGALGTWDAKENPDYIEYFSYSNLENLAGMKAFQTSDNQLRAILDYFENYTVELSDDQLKKIQAETLIILGDDDESIAMREVSRARKNLPKSDLWILPNSPHKAHEGKNKEEFIRISRAFLAGK